VNSERWRFVSNFSRSQLYFPMDTRDDAALVVDSLTGDRRAFGTLVDRYYSPVYNVALRMLRSREDAEDVAQTVFVKAYEKLDTYKARHQFFSWVYRIAVNEAINRARKQSRAEEYESGETVVVAATQATDVSEAELAGIVGDAIMQMSIDHRMVIVLRHYHDFSYQEIASVLEIPEKMVKSRLFTARRRLREILEHKGVTG